MNIIKTGRKKGCVPWNKGLKTGALSEEHKKKIGFSNRGKIFSEQRRKRISLGLMNRVLSKETIKKMSLSLKGRSPNSGSFQKGCKGFNRKHTAETKMKISKSRKGKCMGEKCNFWKGGITRKHYSSNRLERIRFRQEIQKKVLERDKYTCQMCGVRGGRLQVDHIQKWSEYVELRFNIENCRTLCMKCHYMITYYKPMPKSVKTWGHNLKHRGGDFIFYAQ